MRQKALLFVQRYERHFSALAMIAGFLVDSLFFKRIDLWQTHSVFASYTIICFIAIPLLHWMETRHTATPLRTIPLLLTQFALGGFWSGFVIFYGRSAVFGVSWPFLLFLLLVFLGNEYFRQYHARLVFTSVLFFFALYSYAIFALPIYTGTIGVATFLGSGLLAIGIFGLFTILLRLLVAERFLSDIWRIRVGAFCVLLIVQVSYFTNILPPLPLSAEAAGVYHFVWRVPGAYLARTEADQPWRVRYLGLAPTLHTTPGESLYAYGSIFAPTSLTTTAVHRWQWYSPSEKEWLTKSVISYPIVGGRDGGYKGYTAVPVSDVGKWRVDIETVDGRLVARLPFTVVFTEPAPPEEIITL